MYRARIQAISGSKVYADGKWLTCIGNKNFRAGEMIYTDGRCVYGNFQESQQPLVITAQRPQEEGIPIYHRLFGTCYTFQKNNLTQVTGTDFRNMSLINNKNEVFVHPYLAANIDNQGNIFVMAEIKKIDDDGYITEHKVAIFKNDKNSAELKFNKVKEIDLVAWFDKEVYPKCPEAYSKAMDVPLGGDVDDETGHHATPREIGYPTGYNILIIRRAFIEDDNNFEFIVDASAYNDFCDAADVRLASASYDILCQFKNNEKNILSEKLSIGEISWIIDGGYLAYLTEYSPEYNEYTGNFSKYIYNYEYPIDVNNTITCSIGDGYYCTMVKERLPELVEEGVTFAGGEYRYNFFSPNGTELAKTHGGCDHIILVRKIGSNYLIIVSRALKIYEIFGKDFEKTFEFDEYQFVREGTYLYSNTSNELTRLKDIGSSNERLRPMKKIKGWHKRIKEIVLDLDDKKES